MKSCGSYRLIHLLLGDEDRGSRDKEKEKLLLQLYSKGEVIFRKTTSDGEILLIEAYDHNDQERWEPV